MNAQNAHEYLPLIYALANGKTIQHKISENPNWLDLVYVHFSDPPEYYRVKPELRTFELYRNKDTGGFLDVNEIELVNFSEYERITVQEVLK